MPKKTDDVFGTDPEKWTDETFEAAKERLLPIVDRFRKARGELALADAKLAAEKAAKPKRASKKTKENPNLDLSEKP